MARAPASGDWTAIRLAQMRDAGRQFGDFEQAAPNGKLLPRMDAAYARELLKYWLAVAATGLDRTSTKVGQSHIRLTRAVDRFRADMQPFAASVLVDLTKQAAQGADAASVLLPFEACLKFWNATQALTSALAASSWAPDKSDLWWQSVGEQVRAVGKAVAKVAEGGIGLGVGLALVVGAFIIFGNRRG